MSLHKIFSSTTTGENFWIARLGTTGDQYGRNISVHSSGNIYIVAEESTTIIVAKYNNSGVLQWQRKLLSGLTNKPTCITTDSSQNIYIVGYVDATQTYNIYFKLDQNGNLLEQRKIVFSSSSSSKFFAYESYLRYPNLYVVGKGKPDNFLSTYGTSVLKYNVSTNTVGWCKYFNFEDAVFISNADYGHSIYVSSSEDIYVTGTIENNSLDLSVCKCSSTPSVVWKNIIYDYDSDEEGNGIAVDSQNNAYVVGRTTTAEKTGTQDILTLKFNSSGTLQWKRALGFSGASCTGYDIAVDSLDNVYIVGSTSLNGNSVIVAKYNSSGILQWQRNFKGIDNTFNILTKIQIDSLNNLYLIGYTSTQSFGSNDILIAKLDQYGTYVGTFGNFVYTASSLTDKNVTLSNKSGDLYIESQTTTVSSISYTNSTPTFNTSLTGIA